MSRFVDGHLMKSGDLPNLISKGRPPINMDLIKSINETLRSRPKSKWVPMIMIDEEPEDY